MRTMTYDLTAILFISWPQLWFCERLYECVYICTRCWFLSKSVAPKEWKKWVLREIDELNRKQKKNREFTAEEVLSSFLWALSYDRKKDLLKKEKKILSLFSSYATLTHVYRVYSVRGHHCLIIWAVIFHSWFCLCHVKNTTTYIVHFLTSWGCVLWAFTI